MTAEELASLTLEHLRAIRADLAALKTDVVELKVQQSLMGQQLGALTTAFYTSQSRLDKIESHLDRIERRLDLSDAPH